MKPHPQLKKYIGKRCDITVDGITYKNKILFYVGENDVGHQVISTNNRNIHYIEDWNKVSVKLSET